MVETADKTLRTRVAALTSAAVIGAILWPPACGGATKSSGTRAARPQGGDAGVGPGGIGARSGGGGGGGPSAPGGGGQGGNPRGKPDGDSGHAGLAQAGGGPALVDPAILGLGEGRAAPSLGACPEPRDVVCPVSSGEESGSAEWWKVLVDATAVFEPGTRFVSMDDDYLLTERSDGVFEIVYLSRELLASLSPSPPQPVPVSWQFVDRAEALQLRAILRAPGGRLDAFVLGCDPEGRRCRLLWGDSANRPLAEVDGSLVPDGFRPIGLVEDQAMNRICAYGNGLACFDTRWEEVIPQEDDLTLASVVIAPSRLYGGGSYCSNQSVAVGNGGRWWKRIAAGPWEEQVPVATNLLAAGDVLGGSDPQESPTQSALVLIDEDQLWLVKPDGLERCALPNVVAALGNNVIQRSGLVLTLVAIEDRFGWAEIPGVPFERSPLGSTTNTCAMSGNARVFTESQVIGTDFCFLID